MSANRTTVAVIIVTFNSRDDIGPCLESLAGGLGDWPSSVTVVDNQSTDGTASLVRKDWPAVRVIDAGGNLGFARANNLGVRATTSDVVLFLNPDTVAAPGSLSILVGRLLDRPDTAVAGPRLVDRHGAPELSWGPAISPWGELKQKVVGSLYRRRVRPVVAFVERLSRRDRSVPWVTGACLAVRRGDLEAIGGFDERYFLYTEDVDLCVSLATGGRNVLFVSEAQVLHARGQSASRHPESERLRRQSHLAYYEKHHPAWAGLLRRYLKVTGRLEGLEA